MKKIQCTEGELAEKLESTRWAQNFSWNQICKISKHMEAYTAKSGDVIFENHSKDNTMGIVVKGKVDIVKLEESGVLMTIATLQPSHSFGEMSLIDGEPRSARIVAATDVKILLLSKDNLLKLLDDSPSLAFKLLWKISQMLSQRLRKTSSDLVDQLSLRK